MWTQDREVKGRSLPWQCRASLSPFQIILPWLTMSEKIQEQTRALGAIAHLLRFICNFPKLLVSAGWGGGRRPRGTCLSWPLLVLPWCPLCSCGALPLAS